MRNETTRNTGATLTDEQRAACTFAADVLLKLAREHGGQIAEDCDVHASVLRALAAGDSVCRVGGGDD